MLQRSLLSTRGHLTSRLKNLQNSAENAVFTEMLQNSHLDWVENQAYRVYYETSADGRKAAFVYDGALTPFQKISCALESIDLSTMEKDDGPHPPTEFDHQLGGFGYHI
eukprot:jgi/Picre1/29405/NNA_004793.t1